MPESHQSNNPLAPKEPTIHVIPGEFYGLATRANIQAPKPAAAPASIPTPGVTPIAKKAGGGKAWLLIPIIALLILAALGYFVWQFALKSPAAPAPAVLKPAVTLTPPVTAPEITPPVESASATEAATTTEPVVVPPEAATSTEPVAPPASDQSAAPDTDGDGLTNVEEALYGTDPNKVDTDGDSYSDSVEVINLYDPARLALAKLIDSGHVTNYISKEGNYQIFYPTSWTASAGVGGDVVFDNPQNQPISVSVVDNSAGVSVLDWYLNADPGAKPSQVQQFFTKSGLEGVRSPDGRTAYVSADSRIYIISYAPGLQSEVYFRTTFQMMINSFEYRP